MTGVWSVSGERGVMGVRCDRCVSVWSVSGEGV